MSEGKKGDKEKRRKEIEKIFINSNLSGTPAFTGVSFIHVKLNGRLSSTNKIHVPATEEKESYGDTKTNEEHYYHKKALLPSVI